MVGRWVGSSGAIRSTAASPDRVTDCKAWSARGFGRWEGSASTRRSVAGPRRPTSANWIRSDAVSLALRRSPDAAALSSGSRAIWLRWAARYAAQDHASSDEGPEAAVSGVHCSIRGSVVCNWAICSSTIWPSVHRVEGT